MLNYTTNTRIKPALALVTGKRKPPRFVRGMRFDKLLLEDKQFLEGSGFGDYFARELDELQSASENVQAEVFKLNDDDETLPEVSFPVS